MKIPNPASRRRVLRISLARIVSEDSQRVFPLPLAPFKSSKDS